jgi:hypothetical protein
MPNVPAADVMVLGDTPLNNDLKIRPYLHQRPLHSRHRRAVTPAPPTPPRRPAGCSTDASIDSPDPVDPSDGCSEVSSVVASLGQPAGVVALAPVVTQEQAEQSRPLVPMAAVSVNRLVKQHVHKQAPQRVAAPPTTHEAALLTTAFRPSMVRRAYENCNRRPQTPPPAVSLPSKENWTAATRTVSALESERATIAAASSLSLNVAARLRTSMVDVSVALLREVERHSLRLAREKTAHRESTTAREELCARIVALQATFAAEQRGASATQALRDVVTSESVARCHLEHLALVSTLNSFSRLCNEHVFRSSRAQQCVSLQLATLDNEATARVALESSENESRLQVVHEAHRTLARRYAAVRLPPTPPSDVACQTVRPLTALEVIRGDRRSDAGEIVSSAGASFSGSAATAECRSVPEQRAATHEEQYRRQERQLLSTIVRKEQEMAELRGAVRDLERRLLTATATPSPAVTKAPTTTTTSRATSTDCVGTSSSPPQLSPAPPAAAAGAAVADLTMQLSRAAVEITTLRHTRDKLADTVRCLLEQQQQKRGCPVVVTDPAPAACPATPHPRPALSLMGAGMTPRPHRAPGPGAAAPRVTFAIDSD